MIDESKINAMFPQYEDPTSPQFALKGDFRSLAGHLMEMQEAAKTGHAKRSLAEALTLLETASMFAVKALHQG